MANNTHGLILWSRENESECGSPKIIPPEILYQIENKTFEKLNFVFLSFCTVEDEYETYRDNSIKAFFLNIGVKEVVGGRGEITLNTKYLEWVSF